MTIKNCKECGKEVSSKAEKCPHCGAPAARKTSKGVWILLLLVVIFLASYFNRSTTPPTQKPPPTATPERQDATRQLTLKYQWSLGGFGSTMLLQNIVIANPTTTPMKDPMIRCSLYAASGTHLSDTQVTIYQPLLPKAKITIEQINMGNVNSQATKASCRIPVAVTP